MDRVLDDLFDKRGSTREKALSSLIDSITVNCHHQFAGKNFATILYRCLNSYKKGSSNEIILASRLLGLLGITVGSGDDGHELYKESLPLISQGLKSRTDSLFLSMIDCLAVITFVGANDFEETEASLQILWTFIHSKFKGKVAGNEHSGSVLAAAISAWSFLLTTVDGWNLSYTCWKGVIPFFLDLLEADDQSVHIAVCEALFSICEVGSLEKFSRDTKEEGTNIVESDPSIQELQENISVQAKALLQQISDKSSANKMLTNERKLTCDVLKVIEEGFFRKKDLKIGKHSLQLHSWSQFVQANFMKRFLGLGFVKHMLENEYLRDVFNFSPNYRGDGLYVSEREEVTVRVFVPVPVERPREEDLQFLESEFGEVGFVKTKANREAPGSSFSKAKSQLLKKNRQIKVEESRLFSD